ncbi:MAG: hypothetical protein AABX28_00275 [Nanoarchaeota archaeon]
MGIEIPKFVILRGCINCDVSKRHKEKTGFDYGFNHEEVIPCIIDGCVSYEYDLSRPFIDPVEVLNLAKENGNKNQIQNARNYLLHIRKVFGNFYQKIGINLNNFLE